MFQLFFSELKTFFQNKKHWFFIGGVALIPIIYSGMFIWSFWDPYAHTEHLPVAVVNDDKGAVLAGEDINLGDDLVKDLKKDKSFDWHFVGGEKADKGMNDNQYYMKIVIPKDFSKSTTTVLKDHPSPAVLNYKLNSDYNYIAAKMTDAGAKEIRRKLNNEITKTYTKNLYEKIDELADGLKKAGDGAGKLKSGTKQELDGLIALRSNLDKLGEAGIQLTKGVNQLADGAVQMVGGIGQVKKGTGTLYQMTKDNSAKVSDLTNGAKTLADKTNELNNGIQKLVNGNQKMVEQLNGQQLRNGLDRLSDGMKQEYQGLKVLNDQVTEAKKDIDDAKQALDALLPYTNQLKDAEKLFNEMEDFINKNSDQLTPKQQQELKQIKAQLDALKGQLGSSDLSPDAVKAKLQQLEKLPDAIQQLTDGQKKLMGGFNDLDSNLRKLVAGLDALGQNIKQLPGYTSQLADGSKQLADGAEQLNDNWGTLVSSIGKIDRANQDLYDGSQSLKQNLDKLAAGMKQMNEGNGQLADGAGKLEGGMNSLDDGSDELAGKLGDAYNQTQKTPRTNDHAAMFSDPVHTKKSDGTVSNYGEGFTPYFLSLGLFVGALMLTVIYDVRKPSIVPKNGWTWAFGKYIFMMTVGIAQALIADAIIFLVLGLDVGNHWLFIGFSLLASLVFMTIIQFFTTILGNTGRFLVIIILVLQLTTTGGTYPVELLPPALYDFHQWLPMNYSIAGFKNIIAGGQGHLLAHNALMLLVFGLIMLAATTLYLTLAHKKEFKPNQDISEQAS
ncbi:YhgE/Pip family protein [Camelliibacillus cellulosilyticus]|uniref:YhgE/Pip family protein n=1 Tax=Camelliibacillus cellulosilyticus TaxID=2174486 RepID=A0ABV9GP71_9BACL